jgi:hypothetical protein
MKTFTVASIIALASVASAQLDNIPQCALACFVGPLTSDGCAALTDFACHCKKGDELLSKVQPCVQGACSAADQQKAIAAVESTCKAAGVPITIPDTGAAPSSAEAAPASSAAAPSSSKAAVTSAVSSAASAASSAASSAVSSALGSVTPVPMPTVNTSTPSASGSPSSVSQFTGAAAQATQAVGIIGAAALAMLAL